MPIEWPKNHQLTSQQRTIGSLGWTCSIIFTSCPQWPRWISLKLRMRLFVCHFCCISCMAAICNFVRRFPHIQIHIDYDDVWKTRLLDIWIWSGKKCDHRGVCWVLLLLLELGLQSYFFQVHHRIWKDISDIWLNYWWAPLVLGELVAVILSNYLSPLLSWTRLQISPASLEVRNYLALFSNILYFHPYLPSTEDTHPEIMSQKITWNQILTVSFLEFCVCFEKPWHFCSLWLSGYRLTRTVYKGKRVPKWEPGGWNLDLQEFVCLTLWRVSAGFLSLWNLAFLGLGAGCSKFETHPKSSWLLRIFSKYISIPIYI